MKEFKYLFLSQIIAILFLLGVMIGSTIHQVKTVQLPTPKYPDKVMEKAMKFRGTLGCFYDEKARAWLFIDKQGKPCKLFFEKEVKR